MCARDKERCGGSAALHPQKSEFKYNSQVQGNSHSLQRLPLEISPVWLAPVVTAVFQQTTEVRNIQEEHVQGAKLNKQAFRLGCLLIRTYTTRTRCSGQGTLRRKCSSASTDITIQVQLSSSGQLTVTAKQKSHVRSGRKWLGCRRRGISSRPWRSAIDLAEHAGG